MRTELINKVRELDKEYRKIESAITPYGLHLSTQCIFYGERPYELYCGKMEDFQTFIDDIDNIRERYLKHKRESQGIY